MQRPQCLCLPTEAWWPSTASPVQTPALLAWRLQAQLVSASALPLTKLFTRRGDAASSDLLLWLINSICSDPSCPWGDPSARWPCSIIVEKVETNEGSASVLGVCLCQARLLGAADVRPDDPLILCMGLVNGSQPDLV